MNSKCPSQIGRAKAALVSHVAGEPLAIVTTVLARVLRQGHHPRLVVSGPVHFTSDTLRHLQDVVLPAVDLITSALGLGKRSFELSVLNLSAASAHDLGTEVEGYSIDTAAALAMVSAALRLPVRQDIVSTGQIASVAGDIRPVSSLPEKLHAACASADVREFAYPSLSEDRSLEVLAPGLLQKAIDAIVAASAQIRATQIRDLADLLGVATTEEARLQASLSAGYFHRELQNLSGAARVLVNELECSFWHRLELHLNQGQLSKARCLLKLRMDADLKRRHYAAGFGSQLMALVRSVPPAIRRKRGFFPLLPPKTCFEAGCVARAADQPDAAQLLCAAIGQLGDNPAPNRKQRHDLAAPASPFTSLDAVLDAISPERLAQEIGIPADDARGAFTLPSVIIEDYDLFHETITAFHLALRRHAGEASSLAQPEEALGLLERAFANVGGLPAARAEAKFAVEGGMRRILDQMTEQYKNEQRFKRVNRVLKEWLDPLDWERQVELMRALLERLRCHLPVDLTDADPSRFVRRREEIVRAYVHGMDRISRLMRTM